MERLTRRADDLRSQISQTGFAAIDDAFDVDVLEALSEEIDSLHYMASLKASMNSLTTGTGSTIAIKQGVEELDMKVHKKGTRNRHRLCDRCRIDSLCARS